LAKSVEFELDLPEMSEISSQLQLKQALSEMRQFVDKMGFETNILDNQEVDKQIDETLEALRETANQLSESIGENRSNYLSTHLMPSLHELNEKILYYFNSEYKSLRNSLYDLQTLSTISNRLFGFLAFEENSNELPETAISDKQIQRQETSPPMISKTPKTPKVHKRPQRPSKIFANRFYFCYTEDCGGRQYFGLSSMQKHIQTMHMRSKPKEENQMENRFQPIIYLSPILNRNPTPKKNKENGVKPSSSSKKTPKAVVDYWKRFFLCRTGDCDYKCYKLVEMQSHIRSSHFPKNSPLN